MLPEEFKKSFKGFLPHFSVFPLIKKKNSPLFNQLGLFELFIGAGESKNNRVFLAKGM